MVAEDVEPVPPGRPATLPDRWRGRDPGFHALKRSVRAAVLVPGVLAVATYAWGNPQATLIAVFGTFALLLFADFGGPTRIRLRSYLGLWATGLVLITLGTLCAPQPEAAVAGMAVVGFVVLFVGSVSAQAAVGATAALLTFILPVAQSAGPGAIPARLAGWCLAAACCIPAAVLLWPGRWHDPLRRRAAEAADALADLVAAHADGRLDASTADRAVRALADLRAQFEATPYRPTGAGPTDAALSRVIGRLEWLGDNALVPQGTEVLPDDPRARRIDAAVEDVLRELARCIDDDRTLSNRYGTDRLYAAARRMDEVQADVTRSVRDELAAAAPPSPSGEVSSGRSLREVDPSYVSRMLALATAMTVELVLRATPGADGRRRPTRWWDTVSAQARDAATFLTLRSVWFRNSLRGAVALAAAVAVVEVTDVQHGFWVVLGTTSVLRSNALGTGSTAFRAVLGTAIGFAIGSLVLVVLGSHLWLLWIVLPIAVLLAGVAPAVISFVAGQAGFTVTVVVLFKIIHPAGPSVGLLRVEDVAIGVTVSAVVGLLFWPRGATAALVRALGDAYRASVSWLAAEVAHVGDRHAAADPALRDDAIATGKRLDDAFRQFLTERGAKSVPLPTVTHLVTGCSRVRLVAQTVTSLAPVGSEDDAALSDVDTARDELAGAYAVAAGWCDSFADSLSHRGGGPPDVPVVDPGLGSVLLGSFDEERRRGREDGVVASLRLLWLEERLDEVHALEADLSRTPDWFARPG